ncbi:DUF4249 domain-containing protein [Hufsiella ginkgonis]|uniref:DUF4249 family protein n=1 Tax=Hufsiella ginkgonis TaxID=2695274 RepID=A0A7K1XTB7_9SPHI|nr:DUF4249 domain-containing protein [Hufsiella ginkgonis]MXV14088.1 DUF4249 family protein [Hufsiella ginkgonis]
MKTLTQYILAVVAVVPFLSSCEKVIDVKIDTSPGQVVIQGNITNVAGPQSVKISRSVSYTDKNEFPPVSGATVTVTDDAGHAWTFTETQPGIYTYASLKGDPGHAYTLKAVFNNTTYTAVSTMPEVIPVDSLSLKTLTFGDEKSKQVQVHFKDPAGKPNYYRYVMKINNKLAKAVFAENDRFTDGNDITSLLFYNGEDGDVKLRNGDVVEIEMQSVDKNVFDYWFTLSQQAQNGPGGGVTPGNPPSNINNQALGYFSAHTKEVKTITVK